jgi:Rap1a immunity proteins
MAWLRPTFAILITLFGSIADAGPQAVPRKCQAGFYLDGCKDFLAGRSNFLSRPCVGAIEVLDELGSDNKLFCPPQAISNLEQVRVIVTYIEALPKRMMDGFGLLANEAMAKAWPCKT